jgi:hypothetical protein
VLSLSSLIEFLLDMLRDEATQQDFARDPSATLAARGLSGVTAQDIRDVQPMLADVGGVQRVAHEPAHHAAPVHSHAFAGTHAAGGGSGGGHDVVREIHHVTHEYAVARPVTHVTQEYKSYNTFTEFTDRSIHADHGSSVAVDSFNQDNDGVDNKGGTIDGSNVGGHDLGQSGNDVATTTVDGSGNDSHAVTETGSENVEVTQDLDDVANGGQHADPDGEVHHPSEPDSEPDSGDDGHHTSIAYGEPYGSGGDAGDVNDSYSAQSSSASVATSDGAEHAAAGHL